MFRNKEKQEICFCQRESTPPVVELREFENDETGTATTIAHEIMFVMQGTIHIRIPNNNARLLTCGEFIFMPTGMKIEYGAAAGSSVLFVRMTGEMPECRLFRTNTSPTPTAGPGELYTLTANERVAQYLRPLVATLKDGFRCAYYMDAKVREIFFLLHGYYSAEECVNLFAHISTSDIEFSEFVRLNFLKYPKIVDMAGAVNMSHAQFNKRFRKVYGMAPRKWVHREKSRLIYKAICQSDKSFKDIAFEYDFSAQSNFIRYCRAAFGQSPGAIRRGLNATE